MTGFPRAKQAARAAVPAMQAAITAGRYHYSEVEQPTWGLVTGMLRLTGQAVRSQCRGQRLARLRVLVTWELDEGETVGAP